MVAFLIFLPHFIFIPIGCYNTIQLYKRRYCDFIQKRKISLVYGFNIVLILCMLSTSVTTAAVLYFNSTNRTIGYIANVFIVYFVIYYLNVKNWMIYYQYHWTYYTLQLKWTQIINPNVLNQQSKSNWFIKNNHKYNNLSYIYKLFGIIHLTAVIFVSILIYIAVSVLRQTENKLVELLTITGCLSITLVLIIFYGVIVRKTPNFNDIFHIHWESKLVSKVLLIGYVLFFCLSAIPSFCEPQSMVRRIVGGCVQIEILSMWFAISCISTTIVSHKNKTHQLSLSQVPSAQQNSDIDLVTILTDKNSINIFMEYLSREWNMGNLLAYIEFVQFQQHLSDKCDENIVLNKADLVDLPNSIPLSSILETKWSDNELENIKIKTYMMYKKYVEIGSPFEINISYTQQRCIINMVGNLDALLVNNSIKINDLFCIFDDSKIELRKCLDASLLRFKKQPDFNKVINKPDITIITSE